MFWLLTTISHQLIAQESTRVRGVITDQITGEALPFVNVSFDGTVIGTVTDINGKYYIETTEATESLKASFIGYESLIKGVSVGSSQTINFKLNEVSIELEDVVISSKKLRYKNKGNPAVKIVRRVIENKPDNKLSGMDYYEYNKYEKVEFDFNNITEKFMQKRMMRDFQVIFDYMDTSEVNGKAYLPVFLREAVSDVYYRKNPTRYVEHRKGVNMTGFDEYFDNQGISFVMDKIYQDIDIYENNVNILSQLFVSPLSVLATTTYKFHIQDTLQVDGEKLFKLFFQPRNENSLAFVGNMFVTTDSSYAVKKIDMQIADDINLNYVENLFVEQEFNKNEFGKYELIHDKLSIDFDLLESNGIGVFAKRSVSYSDHLYNLPRADSIYAGIEAIVEPKGTMNQTEEFWSEVRHDELSNAEKGVYNMTEEVKKLPAFTRFMDIMTLLTIGYIDKGTVAIGPVGTFYSWNPIEGLRLKIGGMTLAKFSEKWQIQGYGAYGFRDKEWKYGGALTYFFNENPMHNIKFTYQKDINNPGEDLHYMSEDNFLLSFQRVPNLSKIYFEKYKLDYYREIKYGLSYNLGVQQQDIQPGGILSFEPNVINTSIKDEEQRERQQINTTEATVGVRFAPNQKYYQGRTKRIPIPNKYPVFSIRYWHGFEDILGADYSYDRLQLGFSKRFFLTPFGYTDMYVVGTKLWGNVPYPLLSIPRANQTYSYQSKSFNMMNYLEFVSDQQIDIQLSHSFNGFIMNKLPLVKKLKLRTFVTYKMVLGSISDENNPDLNSELAPYPRNSGDRQATFALTTTPYMEASFGVSNIFKFLRLDMVKRLTYLDNPQAPKGWALRAMIVIEF